MDIVYVMDACMYISALYACVHKLKSGLLWITYWSLLSLYFSLIKKCDFIYFKVGYNSTDCLV